MTTYIFLIRMYPLETKGGPKAGAGFLKLPTQIQGKSYVTKWRPKTGETWFLCKLTYSSVPNKRGAFINF